MLPPLTASHTTQDGTSKMSKSAENDLSRINLTDDAAAIKNKVGFAWHDREGWIKDFYVGVGACVLPVRHLRPSASPVSPTPLEQGLVEQMRGHRMERVTAAALPVCSLSCGSLPGTCISVPPCPHLHHSIRSVALHWRAGQALQDGRI